MSHRHPQTHRRIHGDSRLRLPLRSQTRRLGGGGKGGGGGGKSSARFYGGGGGGGAALLGGEMSPQPPIPRAAELTLIIFGFAVLIIASGWIIACICVHHNRYRPAVKDAGSPVRSLPRSSFTRLPLTASRDSQFQACPSSSLTIRSASSHSALTRLTPNATGPSPIRPSRSDPPPPGAEAQVHRSRAVEERKSTGYEVVISAREYIIHSNRD